MIHFVSRASVKIKDSFYTFEYGEDRELEDSDNKEAEIKKLCDDCNAVIDSQIEEIVAVALLRR